jgi:hypothetical protein
MPRYAYDKLFVSCYEPKSFSTLKEAVEHLRSIEQRQFTQLTVEVSVKAGKYKLRAPAALKLDQIEGKTPAEVWELLDRQVDEQIAYFEHGAKAGHP